MVEKGDLDAMTVMNKLISFGVNGAHVFQGSKTRVTKQLKDKYVFCCIGVYDFAHKLAFKSLSSMGVMSGIKDLLSSSCNFFAHSWKKIFQFH